MELEERLYPLDEIELKKRVDENAKATKDPSIEEMAKYLEIPPETLERNQDASPEGSSLPENWERWYSDTLESSEEAKRANRDFRKSPPKGRLIVNGGMLEVPLKRDKVPKLDWRRVRYLVDQVAEDLGVIGDSMPSVASWIREYYEKNAGFIWRKLEERVRATQTSSAKRRLRRHRRPVFFDCTSLYMDRAEALGKLSREPMHEDAAENHVQVVRPQRPPPVRDRKPGLVEMVTVTLPDGFGVRVNETADEVSEVPRIVNSGRRVLCTVGSFEALSSGYIDCLPSQMLADAGATLSLVSHRVLERLGRSEGPFKPYEGRVKSSSGHMLRIYGWVHLELKLGSLVVDLDLLVADQLHVDAILGVDALGAFGAVIDVAERKMTLKHSGDGLPLGVMVVVGEPDDKTVVLMEGTVGLPPSLCVARTLCTVDDGNVIVELCNASTDEFWVTKGTVVASASVVPDSAFENELSLTGETSKKRNDLCDEGGGDPIASLRQEKGEGESLGENVKASKPDVPPDKEVVLEAAFSQSKLSDEQKALFQQELNRFRDMFVESSKKPGRTDLLEFRIDTGENRPIKQQPYRVSFAEGEIMEAEIQQYLELGLIRPSTSPWASPVLMIRKPDDGIRFCIDYRKLNAATVKDCYPMPLIDDILDVLSGAKLFSTMDIASGYWNVPMHEDSISKTAFTCKYGLYEWLVMPFGLCNAVPAFERLMETVLVDLKWRVCLVYLDDCVIFSDNLPSHLVRLRQVLTRFQSAGFQLKTKKCHWGRSQVAFLWHIVTPSGILPNPEKVKAVMNVERPRDVHGIRSFLGLTSYFRRYVPGYALISAPLGRLKVKDAPCEWTEDCETAFRQLKRALVKPPILKYPDMTKRFKLYVDSSRYAKNWINEHDGISEIECWGVVWATRKFRCYLDKRQFDLYTDHQALTWVFSPGNRTINSKLARWAMEQSNLDFKAHHKPGKSLGHVDGLSRLLHNHVNAPGERDDLDIGSEPGVSDEQELPEELADGGINPDQPMSYVDRFGLDAERFLSEQRKVSWIVAVMAFLEGGALPLDPSLRGRVIKMAPQFDVKEGMLMRRVNLPAREGPARSLTDPVVPLPFVETVLHYCHSHLLSSHLGLTKTLEKVKRHAYWPGWHKDVAEYVRECNKCGSGKGSRPWRAGRMQRMPVVDLTGPFSLLVVDAIGPLPATERGNKYILVFVDYFTRWAEGFPVGSLDSVTFVEVMINGVVARHGVPSRLLSDNGTNFPSEVAKSFYQTLGIKKLFGAAYHPQTQGLVERFNGTLIGMLRMHVSEAQDDWDLYLPRVLFAYRTAYHEALGDSPFFSLYGRDPVLPLDVAFLNVGTKWKRNEVAQYRRRLYRSMRDSRHLVERQLLNAQDRHERRLEGQVPVMYEVGDPVWVVQAFRARRGEVRTKKLTHSWHGPYRVVAKVNENAYRIDIPTHPSKTVTVNVNRMKKYWGRWTRPYIDEVPANLDSEVGGTEVEPLVEADLPPSRFAERLTLGGEDTIITRVDGPLVELVAKRKMDCGVEYLALTSTYETFWLPRVALIPEYAELVAAFEQAERKKKGLPELRRSARLADTNARVDDEYVLLV
ncbi:unnamed protein product [Phytophthora fragariaefolia]|uniref:RNA-directed DNA polymerase n=1 Tax=Phytophthora fragariaefolia TaxID=1490495 RepID=A0A9W6XTN7_9STRA|nr:unnamed protein product [Phytophthora fragariaefolia]